MNTLQIKSMRPVFNLILGLAAAVALSACVQQQVQHGHVLRPHMVERLSEGTSTKRDVAMLLGSPTLTGTFDDNTWYYITETVEKEALEENEVVARKVLQITFNENGTIEYMNTFDKTAGRDITPNSRSTPTQGQSLGVVDQLIGNIGRRAY